MNAGRIAACLIILIALAGAVRVPLRSEHVHRVSMEAFPADDTAVRVRMVSAHTIRRFKQDPDFRYDRENTPSMAFLDYLEAKLREMLGEMFRGVNVSAAWKAVEYALYAFGAAMLVFAIVKFIKSDKSGIFFSSKNKSRRGVKMGAEDIHGMDFDLLIAQSIEQGDYRLAVRFLYHKILKELAGRKLIVWRMDKPNLEYVNELARTPYAEEFAAITSAFDHLWYGKFSVSGDAFADLHARFVSFISSLDEGV